MEQTSYIWLFEPGLDHLGRQILLCCSLRSIIKLRRTNSTIKRYIDETPQIWEFVLRKLRRKFCLVPEEFMDLVNRVPKEERYRLCLTILTYQWKSFRTSEHLVSLAGHHYLGIVYGSLQRLNYFYPLVEGTSQPKMILHFLALAGKAEPLRFVLARLRPRRVFMDIYGGDTILHYAVKSQDYNTVLVAMQEYRREPRNLKGQYPSQITEDPNIKYLLWTYFGKK